MKDEEAAQDEPVVNALTIRSRRKKIGRSQTDLAKAAGVSLSTVQKFELNRRAISTKNQLAIWTGLLQLEEQAFAPPVPTVEVPVEDLRAVLDEIRALRRRVEDLALRQGDSA